MILLENHWKKMEYLYEKIQSGELSFQDFKAIFLREVDYDYKKLISEFSKTRQRDYSKYYKKIIDELEKIDFSLQEKYSNAYSPACGNNNLYYHNAG